MAKLQIKKGTTSKRLDIFIQNSSSTTGAGLTGLVYNSAGLTAYYYRESAASSTAITLAAATLGTWATGGFIVIDGTNMPGCYQFDIPDAALATGADSVLIILMGATNMAPLPLEIQLTDIDVHDSQRAGLTGLPSSGTLAVNPTLAGVTHTGAVIPTVSTLTGHTAQTGDNFVRIGAAGAGLTALPWNVAWDAEVQSECADALNVYDSPTKAEMDTAFTEIKGVTWSSTTDTLEALRDRGDAAWTTATGFALAVDYTTARAAKLDNLDATVSSRFAAASAPTNFPVLSITAGGLVDVNDKTGFRLSATGVDDIHDETFESTITWRQLNRLMLSVLAGKSSGGGSATLNFRDYADLINRITATVDANGNRTAITLNVT